MQISKPAAKRISCVIPSYSWFASSVFSLSRPSRLSNPSGCKSLRSGAGALRPLSKELLIGLPLALLAVPQGGAMKIIKILCFSASMISRSNWSCDATVRSRTMISMPQLRSVTLSTAKPLSPSFLHVFVNLADPAQTSSMETPENLWTGGRVSLSTVLGGLVAFCDSAKFDAWGCKRVSSTSETLEKGLLCDLRSACSHEGFDLQVVTLCPGLWQWAQTWKPLMHFAGVPDVVFEQPADKL